MDRTIRLRLNPTLNQAALLAQTTERFTTAFNAVCRYGRIVEGVPAGATIVVENLTNIRLRVRARKANGGQRRLHAWSFANLRAFITYKAGERGMLVESVDPRHTSQTCSRCSFQSRYNRRSQSEFCCRQCGYQTNADRNGALNIAAKLLASRAISASGGPSSTGLSSPPVLATGEGQAVCFS